MPAVARSPSYVISLSRHALSTLPTSAWRESDKDLIVNKNQNGLQDTAFRQKKGGSSGFSIENAIPQVATYSRTQSYE